MAATDEERLVVLLEARIRDYEKNLKKASSTTGAEFNRMKQQAGSATRQMEVDMTRSTSRINMALAATGRQIGAFARSLSAGLIAGGVAGLFTGIIAGARNASAAVAEMAAQARQAGVSFGAFQELQFAAEQNRIGVDALTDGLKELQLRADEFIVTGTGPGAEAFARLGLSAADLAKGLEEPDRLFEEIIDRLSQLDKAAQIRIADEIFGGTAGEQFVRMLDDGADAIRDARKEARDLGRVIEDDVIAEAEELDKRFNEIATTISTRAKTAMVSFADGAIERLESVETVLNRLAENAFWRRFGALMTTPVSDLGDPETALRFNLLKQRQGLYVPPEGFSREDLDLDAGTKGNRPGTSALTFTPYSLDTGGGSGGGGGRSRGGGGGGRSSAASEAEKQAEAIKRVVESLEDELVTLGMSDRAYRVYTSAKEAGVAVGSKEYDQINQLVDAYYDKQEAMDRATETQEFFNDMAMQGFQDFARVIDTGNEALDRMLGTMLELVAQAVIMGEGPLADLFGGGSSVSRGGGGGGFLGKIFGGLGSILGFSDGTPNTGGQRGQARGIVHGQEAVIPLPDGGKVPVEMQAPAAPSKGGNVAHITINNDYRGVVSKTEVEQMGDASARKAVQAVRENLPGWNVEIRTHGRLS